MKLHEVYWGTHGCKRRKGHANPCLCDCKTVLPADHAHVFGDDKSSAIRSPKTIDELWPTLPLESPTE